MAKHLLFLALLSVSAYGQLPSSYDLRRVSTTSGNASWVPEIQNQGYVGDCWTFASATAMNSNLLQSGIFNATSTPPPMQISSWHLSMTNGAPESLVGPNYGGSGVSGWGGFEYQTLGYVTRGQGAWAIPGYTSANATTNVVVMGGGPVTDSQNSKNPFPAVFQTGTPANISNLVPPANQVPAYTVTSMTLYQQGFSNNVPLPAPITPGGSTYNFTQGKDDRQVKAVKNAILQYGAVTTSVNAHQYYYFDPVNPVGGNYTMNYFNPSKNPYTTDHEVTIIGWDDTHQITDPTTNATYTGAWHVQNSWGTSWNINSPANPNTYNSYNNDGTFWAAYDDAAVGRTGVASFKLAPPGTYSPTVLQNELGPLSYSYYYPAGSGPLGMDQWTGRKAASILTPTSDGQLLALGLCTQVGNATVTAKIYDSWNNGPSNLLSTESFFMGGIGYQLNPLATPINLLSGNSIVVELTYDTDNAIPVVIGGTGLNGYTSVTDGLSYYWDSGNGTWQDFSKVPFDAYSGSSTANITGGILFVKGVLAVPEPGPLCLIALSIGALLAVRFRVDCRS